MRHLCILFTVLFLSLSSQGQFFSLPYIETITKAGSEGITLRHLDSLYKSAVHIDSTLAVFKPGREQDSFVAAYTNFLRELGRYLRDNNFTWEQPTKCWNRIYFKGDGRVDYYLFEFKTPISDDKLAKFKQLFRSFAATHKIGMTAGERFAQCSPVTYMDK